MLKAKEKNGIVKLHWTAIQSCCGPDCCNSTEPDPQMSSIAIGYDGKVLDGIPKSSILGLGCGAPINYANLKAGEFVG